MGVTSIDMAIIGENPSTCQVERFIELWNDESDTVVVHTSGSTGIPKLIPLLKRDMEMSARVTCGYFKIKQGDLLFLPLPIDYIAGKMMVVRAQVSGADLIVEHPTNQPLQVCPPSDIQLAAIVPSQVPGLLESKWFGSIKHLIIGGAPISQQYENMLVQSGVDAYATYGMTETASHVALRKMGNPAYEALPHIHFSTDSRSCLVIESENMSFSHLITNDIVQLIDNKTFLWLGRYDNVINSGGIKVLPEKIEEKLTEFIPGRAFFITSRPSAKWGSEVVLVVEGTEPIDEDAIASTPNLLKAERPKAVIYKAQLSRTSSGKLIRKI